MGSEYYGGVPRDVGTGKWVTLYLVREPTNEHDRNAVKVLWGQRHVGYLSSARAEKAAPYLDRIGPGRVFAVTGIARKESRGRGLRVWLPTAAVYPHRT